MTKIKSPKGQYTLDAWEAINGELSLDAILSWVDANNLSHIKIKRLIEEFKLRMLANGNVYADFRAAFKVWFMKGWLGLTIEQAKISDSNNQLQNVAYTKGTWL